MTQPHDPREYPRAPYRQQQPSRPPWDQVPPQQPRGPQQAREQGPAGPVPPRPRRRRHTLRNVLLSVTGVLVLGIAVAVMLGVKVSGSPAESGFSQRAVASAAAAPASGAPGRKPAAAPSVIASFSGSGPAITASFNVPGSWVLDWSYNCDALGTSGSFVLSEDGGVDFNGANFGQQGRHGSGSTRLHRDAGSHYLQIVTGCSWSVQVMS